jgi:hypothetical protein
VKGIFTKASAVDAVVGAVSAQFSWNRAVEVLKCSKVVSIRILDAIWKMFRIDRADWRLRNEFML